MIGTSTRAARLDERRRGSMLIVALGVLTLLTVLAITFVALMKLELQASKNYVDGVKSRLIAEGGLEKALAELKFRGGIEAASSIDSPWVYANGHYELPLEQAEVPFLMNPVTNLIDVPNPAYVGKDAGLPGQPGYKPANACSYWGSLGQSYSKGWDRYKVSVIDAQTQFNLNSTFDEDTYIRFLSVLGAAVAQTLRKPNPILGCVYPRGGGANAKFGAAAVLAFRDSREGKIFKTKSELQEILATEDDWITLRNYITTKSWVDPAAVNAMSLEGFDMKYAPWAEASQPKIDSTSGGRPIWRAPINVNLASREVLAADLAGLAGRALYLHVGDWNARQDPAQGILQKIDESTKYEFGGTAATPVREELKYGPETLLVYVDPFGIEMPPSKDLSKDAPKIDGALWLADQIIERRKTVGPFKSFAEWDRFIDAVLNDDALQASTGTYNFPTPSTARVYHLDKSAPKLDPTLESEVKNSVRFKQFFFECVRSVFKANANPNPRISAYNPNAPVYLEVDKGSLFTPKEPDKFPDSKFVYSTQTCEWCFSPKGVYEIMALGEVLGEPDATVSTGTTGPQYKIYAQSKILSVIQLSDCITHTSQMDFESKGKTYAAETDRLGMLTQPITKLFWDPAVAVDDVTGKQVTDQTLKDKWLEAGGNMEGRHAHEVHGYLELSPRIQRDAPLDPPSDSHVLPGYFGTQERFALLMDVRRAIPAASSHPHNPFEDNSCADIGNMKIQRQNVSTDPLGKPTYDKPTDAFAIPQEEGPAPGLRSMSAWRGLDKPAGIFLQETWKYEEIFPDGLFLSNLRNQVLWYRASDKDCNLTKGSFADSDRGYRQGDSQINLPGAEHPGNVFPTPKGAVEFWYKPEFDWMVRKKASGGGKFSDPTSAPWDAGGGQFMADDRFCGLISTSHVTENLDVMAPAPAGPNTKKTRGTQMFVVRTTSGDLRVTRLYFEVIGPGGSKDPKNTTEFPLVRDIKAVVPGPAGSPPGNAGLITLTDYMEKATTDPDYTWPPLEFQRTNEALGYRDIKFARTDAWVPAKYFKDWRAHEWHHFAIWWDDTAGVGITQGGPDPGKTPAQNAPTSADNVFVVFLDGARLTKDVVINPTGKVYQATMNKGGPVQPPPNNPPDSPRTPFVRLNARVTPQAAYPISPDNKQYGQYPKDMLTIGSIWREQADRGGIYKFTPHVLLPAHGTIDDVRFWDGNVDLTNKNGPGGANRYQEGIWTSEIDLSDRFGADDVLKLGQMSFTAYLPRWWGQTSKPDGGGTVRVTVSVLTPDGQVQKSSDGDDLTFVKEFTSIGPATGVTDPATDPSLPFRALVTAKGAQAEVHRYPPAGGSGTSASQGWRYDRVQYKVEMEPFRSDGGFKVATPALDDITISYYLPTPRVLLKEKVYD